MVNLATVGACSDGSDLRSADGPPVVPPPSGYSHPSGDAGTPATPLSFTDVMRLGLAPTKPASVTPHVDPTSPRPTPGPVELRQSRLDTWPTMGPCPDWGAPAGAGWVQAFRYASPYSNTYPDGQPNNCKQIPPQSHIPYLTPYTYPTNVSMNDKVRAFFSWASYLQCIRVTLKEHDWGGGTVTYQGCNTTPNTYLYVWSPNVQSDAGYDLGVTQVTAEWWAI